MSAMTREEYVAAAKKALDPKQGHFSSIPSLEGRPNYNEYVDPAAMETVAKLVDTSKIVELEQIDVERMPKRYLYRFAKRVFDIVACSCALVVCAIPMAVIAYKIKRDSLGPVLYKQERDEQVIIRHNFGSCLLNTIEAQLDNGFELVLNKPKCAFGRKGRDFVSSAASMMVAA